MTRELLERKFPVGTRVKLIEGRCKDGDNFGVKNGTLGTVTGINDFGGIDVQWDGCQSNYDLFFGYDRFSIVYGR